MPEGTDLNVRYFLRAVPDIMLSSLLTSSGVSYGTIPYPPMLLIESSVKIGIPIILNPFQN